MHFNDREPERNEAVCPICWRVWLTSLGDLGGRYASTGIVTGSPAP